MIVLSVGENRMIVASFVSIQYQRVTEDRQTDGRTDRLACGTAVSIASYADARCKKEPFQQRSASALFYRWTSYKCLEQAGQWNCTVFLTEHRLRRSRKMGLLLDWSLKTLGANLVSTGEAPSGELSGEFSACCFRCADRKSAISVSSLFDLNDLEHNMSHVTLCTGIIFIKLELG